MSSPASSSQLRRQEAAAALQDIGDTVIIYSHGHEIFTCVPNVDGLPDHLNRLGYDVMEVFCALKACNAHPGVPKMRHSWLGGRAPFPHRVFFEPLLRSFAHATRLGYKHIVLAGLSNGAWCSVWAAALLPQAQLTISIGNPFHPDHGDPLKPNCRSCSKLESPWKEEDHAHPFYRAIGSTDIKLYELAALEPQRFLIEIRILHDNTGMVPGKGVTAAMEGAKGIFAYNKYVQGRVRGWMQTALIPGRHHEVNPPARVLIALVVERLRSSSQQHEWDWRGLAPLPFDLPFDLLKESSLSRPSPPRSSQDTPRSSTALKESRDRRSLRSSSWYTGSARSAAVRPASSSWLTNRSLSSLEASTSIPGLIHGLLAWTAPLATTISRVIEIGSGEGRVLLEMQRMFPLAHITGLNKPFGRFVDVAGSEQHLLATSRRYGVELSRNSATGRLPEVILREMPSSYLQESYS